MHRENIERVANEALANANISIADVDAIAVTNRPGAFYSQHPLPLPPYFIVPGIKRYIFEEN